MQTDALSEAELEAEMPEEKSTDAPFTHPFGIGCFQFIAKEGCACSTTVAEYVDMIKGALSDIDTVKDIEFAPSPLSPQMSENIEIESTCFDDREISSFAYLEYWIKFRIDIPYRIQEELSYLSAFRSERSESFTVFIMPGYHLPLTVVFCESENETRPASSVVILRRFLEKRINDNPKHKLKIDCLGPSPFHADFFVSSSHDEETHYDGFSLYINEIPGYDLINVKVPNESNNYKAQLSNLNEMWNCLMQFYYIVCLRNKSLDLYIEIMNQFSRIKDSEFEKKYNMGELFLGRKDIRDLFSLMIDYRINQMNVRSFYKSERSEKLGSRDEWILGYMKRYEEEFEEFPYGDLLEFTKFIEQNRKHKNNIAIAIIAAITGGSAGVIINHLLKAF